MRRHLTIVKRFLGMGLALGACVLFVMPGRGWAAETADPILMKKTVIILKLGSHKPLETRTSFSANPPTITILFPSWQVISALPERSAISTGLIQMMTARYESSPGPHSQRFLRSVDIVLSAPYAHRVRSEPGRVVVEIEHPASVGSTDVEVGLKGGTIVGGFARSRPSERFQAMQEALTRATPTPWTLQVIPPPPASEQPSVTAFAQRPASTSPVVIHAPAKPAAPTSSGSSPLVWVAVAVALAIIGTEGARRLPARLASRPATARPPSGIMLIDQLVWRAFERQGYALLAEMEITQPLAGTLRVIVKDGVKAAFMVVGNGLFFEKQTVQQFLEAMRTAEMEQGFLVASGSFTVPAQRLAQEHQVTLIGREQLTELLSIGARSEYLTRELEEQRARIEEAKETLQQYAEELDTLRRQRNEASWYLGEERAKSAGLESQVEAVTQQLRHHEAQLQRWQQEAATIRKQWEENEWYVGEARARVGDLERHVTALQDLAARVESAQRERDEATWYLGEERARGETFEAQLAQLQRHLEESTARERTLQAALDQLKQELGALRTLFRERRRGARAPVAGAHLELRDGSNEPIFAGSPRDVSRTGVGIESDQELPERASARIRMSLPGCDLIESRAQLKWRRVTEGTPPRYQVGYRLLGISKATRELIQQIVQHG